MRSRRSTTPAARSANRLVDDQDSIHFDEDALKEIGNDGRPRRERVGHKLLVDPVHDVVVRGGRVGLDSMIWFLGDELPIMQLSVPSAM